MNNEISEHDENPFPPRNEALIILFITFLIFVSVGLLGELVLGKIQILLGELFLLAPAYLYVRWRRFMPALIFRLRPVGWRIIMVSVMIGLALTIVGDEIDRLMSLILPLPEIIARLMKELLTAHSLTDWLIIAFGAVLFAGLFEEMLFRGFLQGALEQHSDVTRAVLLTALLFAIIHVNPWWIVQIIVLGVFLGVLAWKSDSIIPGAIVHAINNGISVAIINAGEEKFRLFEWNGHVHPLLLLAAITSLIFGLRLFYQFCEEESEVSTLLNTPLT